MPMHHINIVVTPDTKEKIASVLKTLVARFNIAAFRMVNSQSFIDARGIHVQVQFDFFPVHQPGYMTPTLSIAVLNKPVMVNNQQAYQEEMDINVSEEQFTTVTYVLKNLMTITPTTSTNAAQNKNESNRPDAWVVHKGTGIPFPGVSSEAFQNSKEVVVKHNGENITLECIGDKLMQNRRPVWVHFKTGRKFEGKVDESQLTDIVKKNGWIKKGTLILDGQSVTIERVTIPVQKKRVGIWTVKGGTDRFNINDTSQFEEVSMDGNRRQGILLQDGKNISLEYITKAQHDNRIAKLKRDANDSAAKNTADVTSDLEINVENQEQFDQMEAATRTKRKREINTPPELIGTLQRKLKKSFLRDVDTELPSVDSNPIVNEVVQDQTGAISDDEIIVKDMEEPTFPQKEIEPVTAATISSPWMEFKKNKCTTPNDLVEHMQRRLKESSFLRGVPTELFSITSNPATFYAQTEAQTPTTVQTNEQSPDVNNVLD